MAKKKPTPAERKHMGAIASMDCACCGFTGPSEVHHIREGSGMAQRSSSWLTIPLCRTCHGQDLGGHGVHGDKSMMRIMELTELDMLAATIEKLVA